MKGKLVFVVAIVIALSITTVCQESPSLYQVTLYSKIGHREWHRASINFESGKRGSPTADLSDFDLVYGNLAVDDDSDWFAVSNPRSIIVDLGKKQWKDFNGTPKFLKDMSRKPLPLGDAPFEVDASANSKDISPYKQFVQVKAGHMYLMRVVRGRTNSYVMFRVDNLVRKDNCLLSWKKVQPPRDDIEK